jgi:hypothetical protein
MLADKVGDIANLISAAVVIGFLVGEQRTSALLVVAVIALWLAAMLVAALAIGGTR